jgi:hypothetical protein
VLPRPAAACSILFFIFENYNFKKAILLIYFENVE